MVAACFQHFEGFLTTHDVLTKTDENPSSKGINLVAMHCCVLDAAESEGWMPPRLSEFEKRPSLGSSWTHLPGGGG